MAEELKALRGEIDRVDSALVPLLVERMRLSDEVGRIKSEKKLPVRDETRERALLQRIRAQAGEDCAESVEQVYREILAASRARQTPETRNLLLIGMPGCGKTTVGAALAGRLGRRFVDLDAVVVERDGRGIPEIFAAEGEEGFRRREHEALCDTAKQSGLVIAAGGGIVTRPENLPIMRQNAVVIWLRRDLDKLPTEGRPLSQANSPEALYRVREPLYRAAADLVADNNGSVEETTARILDALCGRLP